ncbi:hypothetical protein GDO86_001421 [Hymenochirus boettgeri]|uniref:Uncharacterized protein n=1 Tax=Hymenochirus boettgeri TaxID=247094 RepID=A0A8T2KL01_9PIPI|nr:hypothetical protein GDO86_001421 [Hymenochirus boettgeri]
MWTLQETLLALMFCIIFVKYLHMRWTARIFPPGPTPLPLIGNLLTIKFKLHPETLQKITKTYGNIYTLWLGHTPLVVLNGCQTIKEGLVSNSEELSGRPLASYITDLTKGKGIVYSIGHTWKQQRRFGLMALRNMGLGKQGLESRIQEEAQFLKHTLAAMNGKPTNPSDLLSYCVANIICAMVFGYRFSTDDPLFQKLVKNNHIAIDMIGSAWGRLYDAFPALMRYLPGPHQKTFEIADFHDNFVIKEIRLHEQNGSQDDPQDIIGYYLAQIAKTKHEPDSTFDVANMIQLVKDLFGAGTETTATTLQWALLYMVAYPDIQKKVQEELDTVLQGSQLICYEDRKRLPYTNAVIHEVHRYANISALGVPRSAIKQFTLNGYTIKKVVFGRADDKTELFILFSTLLQVFSFQLPKGITKLTHTYLYICT